jgi:predicted ATPase
VPEVLARHASEAGLKESAVSYWQRAGQRATQRSAYREAVGQIQNALDLVLSMPASSERDERELELLVDLNGPLIAIKGFTADETDRNLTRALDLCRRIGETPMIFPALYSRYMYQQSNYMVNKALETGREFVREAEQQGDTKLLPIGRRMMGAAAWRSGAHSVAADHFEQVLALYNTEIHRPLMSTFGVDSKAAAMALRSVVLWMLGHPERAIECVQVTLDHARAIGHPSSLAYALGIGLMTFHAISGDFDGTERCAEELSTLAEEFELAHYPLLSRFHRGRGLLKVGRIEEGLGMMRENFRDDPYSEWHWNWEFHAALLAEALGHAGEPRDGLEWLDRAQSFTHEGGGRAFEPEIWRTKGDLQLIEGSPDQAEQSFSQAIEVAGHQQAKSLQLRAATRLARLWQSQGKTTEARDLLAPVYSWFTEGFDTTDLKEAKALLDELS